MKKITEILHVLYVQESPEVYPYVWLIIGILAAAAVFHIICLCRKSKRMNGQTDFTNWNTENIVEPIPEYPSELRPEQEPVRIPQQAADMSDWLKTIQEVEREVEQRSRQRKKYEVTEDDSSGMWSWSEDFATSDPDNFFTQSEKKQKKKKEKLQNRELAGETQDDVNLLNDLESRETQNFGNPMDEAYRYGEMQDEST